MRIIRIGLCVTALSLYCIGIGANRASGTPPAENPCCAIVQQALRDYGSIHQGTTRAALEQAFTEGDGPIFAGGATSYVYRRCRYITIDVKFQPAAAGEKTGSDTVISVSKLSIDYEAKD